MLNTQNRSAEFYLAEDSEVAGHAMVNELEMALASDDEDEIE